MNTKIAAFIIVFFVSVLSSAQNDDSMVKNMLEQAGKMGEKFVARDYKGFIKYAHPATIDVMGGEQQAVTKITKEMKSVNDEGIIITNISFGIPSKILVVNNEFQCTIPQIMEMQVPGGKITGTTTMLAISTDKGKSWSFLDTANYNFQDMKSLLPNLSEKIVIPERATPVFEPTESKETKTE